MKSVPLRLAFNTTLWSPSYSEWLLAGKYIQPEERKRISEFHYKNDAKLSLVGRLLLRYAITMFTGIEWESLCLLRDEKAKPILAPHHKLSVCFNASHQGDFVVVAADSVNVGVDVMDATEMHGDTEKFFSLMKRHFTSEEWKEIKTSRDDSSQMKAFYRHWCLKESFVKAIGSGISYSLLSLNFVTNTPLCSNKVVTDTFLHDNKEYASNWTFEESLLGGNHIVAVARNTTDKLKCPFFKVIDFAELIRRGQPLVSDIRIDEAFLNCFHKPYKLKKSSSSS